MIQNLVVGGLLTMLAVVDMFTPSGDVFGRKVGSTYSRVPYEVVDTLTLSSGFGAIVLNKHFTGTKRNVLPTCESHIYPSVTQIIDDTSATVNYYAVYISEELDSVIVKSNSASDSSRVRLRLLMR